MHCFSKLAVGSYPMRRQVVSTMYNNIKYMKFIILALFLAVKYTGKLLALFGGCRSFGIIILRFWKRLELIRSKREFLSSLDWMSFYLICNTMDVMTSFVTTLTWKRTKDLLCLITWLKRRRQIDINHRHRRFKPVVDCEHLQGTKSER